MHLYGGAAAMLDDVMRVQWEVEVYCARVTCAGCIGEHYARWYVAWQT